MYSVYFSGERLENPENCGELSLIRSHSAFGTSREGTVLQGQNLFTVLRGHRILNLVTLPLLDFGKDIKTEQRSLLCVAGGVSDGIWSQV